MTAVSDAVLKLSLDTRSAWKNVDKDAKKSAAAIKKSLGKVMEMAAGGNFTDKMLRDTRKKMEEMDSKIQASRKKALEATRSANVANITAEEKSRLESIAAVAKAEHDALVKRYNEEAKNIKAVAKRRAESYDKEMEGIGVKLGEGAEAFGESMHEIFSDIASKDLGSIIGTIGKMGQKMKKAGDMARAGQGTGSMGKIFDKIGGILGKIGPALVAIGAIAGGMAAVVKMIIDADSQAKELHRTLMDSGTSLGDMAGGAQDVRKAFDEVRDAAIDVKNNYKWGTLAADQLKILGAFNNTVFTLKKMGEGLKTAEERMTAYQKATSAALVYSKLLGESAETVAQQMGDMMEDLGLSLSGVKEKFAAIYEAAQTSGYGTKRFFGMVLQATTGMSMYNVRLEQTAGMLLALNKILGTKFGPDFFQSLTKGFTDESFQDRYKRVLITGEKKLRGIMSKDAEATAEAFVGGLAAAVKDQRGNLGDTLAETFKEVGAGKVKIKGLDDLLALARTPGAKQQDIAKSLQKVVTQLDPKQANMAIAKLESQGFTQMSQQMRTMVRLQKGATGSTGELLQALDSLSPGGTMVSKLAEIEGWFGPIEKLDTVQLMAVENMMGISGEQLKQLQAVSGHMKGQWNLLEAMKESGVYQGKNADQVLALQRDQQKKFGAFLGTDNKIYKATFDNNGIVKDSQVELKDQNDFLMKATEIDKASLDVMSRQEALAQEVASSTTDMTTYLQQGVEYFLNGIFKATQSILSWVSGGLSEDEKKAQQEALAKQNEIIKALQAQQKEAGQKVAQARVGVSAAKTPEERKAKEEELKTAEQAAESIRGQLAMEQKLSEAIQNNTDSNWTFDKTAKEFREDAQKKIMGEKETRTTSVAVMGGGMSTGKTETVKSFGDMIPIFQAMKGEQEATRKMQETANAAMVPFQEEQAKRLQDLALRAESGNMTAAEIAAQQEAIRQTTVDSAGAQKARDMALFEMLTAELGALNAATALGLEGVSEEADKAAGKKEVKDKVEAKKRLQAELEINKAKRDPNLAKLIAEEQQKQFLKSVLRMGGVAADQVDAVADAIMKGEPAGVGLNQETLDLLSGDMQAMGMLGPRGAAWVKGQQKKDFFARMGDRGQLKDVFSIDPSDALGIVGAKPGGALDAAGKRASLGVNAGMGGRVEATETVAGVPGAEPPGGKKGKRAGAGGNVTNVFNLYDSGRGALKVIQDAQRAGALP